MAPADMVSLADAAANGGSWKQMVPSRFSSRRRQSITEAVFKGLKADPPETPPRRPTSRQTEQERIRLQRLEKKRDEQAAALGIDPTLIANRLTLAQLAKDWTQHAPELMPWQRQLLATE